MLRRVSGCLFRASTHAKLTFVLCDPHGFLLRGVLRNGPVAMLLAAANLAIIGKMEISELLSRNRWIFKMVS